MADLGWVVAGLVLGQWAVTQWLAEAFGGQAGLGRPWFQVGDLGDLRALELGRLGPTSPRGLSRATSLGGSSCRRRAAFPSRAGASLESAPGRARLGALGRAKRSGASPVSSARCVGVASTSAHGERKGRAHYLRHDGPEHVLAFAPTRSGKGVGLVIPTLLSWRESAVVLDIKGENWEKTAGWRQQCAGQRVIRFDPGDAKSARFNPLAEIRLRTPHEVADVQNIATMLVDPKGEGFEDKHWSQTAWSLLVGAILHVCYREAHRGHNGTLADVAEELSRDTQVRRARRAMARLRSRGCPRALVIFDGLDADAPGRVVRWPRRWRSGPRSMRPRCCRRRERFSRSTEIP